MSVGADFAHTQQAEQNRVFKARKIARWLWERNLSYSDVLGADDARRRAWARAAMVTPPSTMETWQAVNAALMAMEQYAEDHPDHPSVQRPYADEKAKWLGGMEPAEVAPQAPVEERVASVTALPTPEPELFEAPVDPLVAEEPAFQPRGWAELVALGPIGRPDARCSVCRMPAVTAMPEQWRCAQHPPQPGEWGVRLDWTPADMEYHAGHCPEGRRCYEPRCPNFKLNTIFRASDSALLDERAAANGKNRAPAHVRQAARAAEEARKARR